MLKGSPKQPLFALSWLRLVLTGKLLPIVVLISLRKQVQTGHVGKSGRRDAGPLASG